jgi:hypothetical protein
VYGVAKAEIAFFIKGGCCQVGAPEVAGKHKWPSDPDFVAAVTAIQRNELDLCTRHWHANVARPVSGPSAGHAHSAGFCAAQSRAEDDALAHRSLGHVLDALPGVIQQAGAAVTKGACPGEQAAREVWIVFDLPGQHAPG